MLLSAISGRTAWAHWQAALSATACTRPILGHWQAVASVTVSHLRKGNLGSACVDAGGPLGPPLADCRLLLGPETSMEAAKGRAPRSKETWRDTALSSGGWWAVQTSHSTKKASTRGMTCGTKHQCPAGVVAGGLCTPGHALHLRHDLAPPLAMWTACPLHSLEQADHSQAAPISRCKHHESAAQPIDCQARCGA